MYSSVDLVICGAGRPSATITLLGSGILILLLVRAVQLGKVGPIKWPSYLLNCVGFVVQQYGFIENEGLSCDMGTFSFN